MSWPCVWFIRVSIVRRSAFFLRRFFPVVMLRLQNMLLSSNALLLTRLYPRLGLQISSPPFAYPARHLKSEKKAYAAAGRADSLPSRIIADLMYFFSRRCYHSELGVSTCSNGIRGIEARNANGVACCPLTCIACGGEGCDTRPGGKSACCIGQIKFGGEENNCAYKGEAPCFIGERVLRYSMEQEHWMRKLRSRLIGAESPSG